MHQSDTLRVQLPRLRELRALITDHGSANAYFQNFDNHVRDSRHVREIYGRWEIALQGLDDDAWAFLKCEAAPYLTHKDRRGRGWEQLFGILNQAHAYNYLRAIGVAAVRYVPRAKRRSLKTPDLEGALGSRRILCEVKTMNISEDEIRARGEFMVREAKTRLDDAFLRKLDSTIAEAKLQICAYDDDGTAQHYIFISPNFDDFLGEYKEEYFRQLDAHLSACPMAATNIVFFNDHTPFFKTLSMKAATVVNAL
jgi:hypothetical protein